MRALDNFDPRWIPVPLRVVMGIILIVAGYQKLMNLGGTAGFFGQVGIPAPEVMAAFIAGLELIGGLLLIVGLGVRWVAVLYVCEFLVAAFVVKLPRMGWDPTRIDFMMLAGALTLLLAGAGAASVDAMLARRRTAVAA